MVVVAQGHGHLLEVVQLRIQGGFEGFDEQNYSSVVCRQRKAGKTGSLLGEGGFVDSQTSRSLDSLV